MCGVFDGHAGPFCAQLVSERLFYYLHFAKLSNAEIEKMLQLYYTKKPLPLHGMEIDKNSIQKLFYGRFVQNLAKNYVFERRTSYHFKA